MTDQTIPADKVREIASRFRDQLVPHIPAAEYEVWERATEAVEALLPPPPRPTLADMTDEERAACQWMQADVRNFDRRMVITEVRTSCADLIERDGERWNVDLERVTPRPDLRRMTWPGNKKPDTVPPNTMAVGSVWDDSDALARACEESGRTQITAIDRDGDVSVWDASAENWHGPHPIPKYAPYTITHTGRKANQ